MRANAPVSALRHRLDGLYAWLGPLGLRLLLAWEYFEAGREKWRGENWFADIQSAFPFPFDRVPADLSWSMATWAELLGGLALLLGLATRLTAAALIVLTVVAIGAVHWPASWDSLAELAQGYAISDAGHGNYKLPLLFLAMLLPLALGGGGKLSLDALIARGSAPATARADARTWGAFALATGIVVAMLLPWFGFALALAGVALLAGAALGARSGRAVSA